MSWFENLFKKPEKNAREEAENRRSREEVVRRLTETAESGPRNPKLDRLNEEANTKSADKKVISIDEGWAEGKSDKEIADKIAALQERKKEIQGGGMASGFERTFADTELLGDIDEEIIKLESILAQRQQG